jgi:hypothetical protein
LLQNLQMSNELKYLIGLARQQCPCDDTAPEGYNVSASGFYITDLEPFGMLEGLEDCEHGGVWAMLEAARTEAVQTFQTDMITLLSQRYTAVRKPFKGVLGETGGTTKLDTTKQYVGARLYCGNVKGGTLQINELGTLFENDGAITLYIYNNLGELLHTIEDANTTAGRLSRSPLNIKLPMWHDFTNHLEYFFIYEYDATNRPIVNKAHCGCGGFDPDYNVSNSYVSHKHTGSRSWASWFMIGSYEANSVEECMNNTKRAPNRFNGLVLSVEVYCKAISLLTNDGDINFEANPLAMAYATAIRYKAAETMANKLLLSNNLNRAVMINREQIAAERETWRKQYLEITQYLSQITDISQNDCFCEKRGFEMRTNPILA